MDWPEPDLIETCEVVHCFEGSDAQLVLANSDSHVGIGRIWIQSGGGLRSTEIYLLPETARHIIVTLERYIANNPEVT